MSWLPASCSAISRDRPVKVARETMDDDSPHYTKHGTGRERLAKERIAKAIARAGLASRREAEDWIAAGRVAVNGAVIDSPALNVTALDHVTVDGVPLPARQRTRL